MNLLDALQAFHFLRPLWLLALPLVWLAWRARGQSTLSPWAGVVDPQLLPYLLETQPGEAYRHRAWALALLTLLGILALAGPAFRLAPQAEIGREAGLVLALDLSTGMLAPDMPPDRLRRARFEIADLLRMRSDGQTALIAYAGEAFTVAPLTDDATTLESLLGALSPEIMPVSGQRPERALRLAEQLIENAGMNGGDVLLLSYTGGAAAEAEAARLAERGIRTSLLVFGTDAGAPLPQTGGGFRTDQGGQVQMAPRELGSARSLASAGGGLALPAAADDSDTRRLYALWESAGGDLREREEQGALRYRDEGPWLALLALLPALVWLRTLGGQRALLGLLLCAGVLQAPAVRAEDGPLASLWARADQRAWQALEQGDPARARQLAEDPAVVGAAAFREGDFASAAEAFGARQDAVGLYNRGTALAKAGQLQQALQALDAALALDPQMEDARFNRDLVADALAQQPDTERSGQSADQPGEPQEGEQGGEGEQQPAEGEQSQSTPGQTEQGRDGDSEAQSDMQDAAEGEATEESLARQAAEAQREAMEQALAEQREEAAQPGDEAAEPLSEAMREQRQASEQLLRRIPDDPGALLRRKFALEQRRRVLEGEQQ